MPQTNITVYGANWCPDCRRAKKFLGEHRVHYTWIDIEGNPDGMALVEQINQGRRIIPTIIFEDGSILVEPSNADLAAKLGMKTQARLNYYDLIVIGGGPAGLTAAIYAAREGLDVLVVEKSGLGGQAAITECLENYPGFPDGITGDEFADRLARQAWRFGVETLQAQEVTCLRVEAESRYIATSGGAEYGARAILVATGSSYRRLEVPGEEELIGSGVHFCATCDGPFYKDQPVAVIGGGNSAGEESLFLARFASRVTILVRGPEMKASKIVVQKLSEQPKIELLKNTEVVELKGDGRLSGIVLRSRVTGEIATITPKGVFVFIGQTPNTAWLPAEVKRDEYGFMITSPTLETSLPGVFAAGDARQGSTKQAASAIGEGAAAALMIRQYLKQV
jgi:thioredoxin reductase (NADPH)